MLEPFRTQVGDVRAKGECDEDEVCPIKDFSSIPILMINQNLGLPLISVLLTMVIKIQRAKLPGRNTVSYSLSDPEFKKKIRFWVHFKENFIITILSCP